MILHQMMTKTSYPKTLFIDIETFSSVDLAKCGVYRYVEAPDFEVLLFGFSIDGSDVQVVDLANGESIPPAILSYLEDDTIIKYAFNASFERICLSRHLGYLTGKYLDPDSWCCSLVWAAYLGLPLSLQGVGSVLKLERQKMTEGKDLIKYFCMPCSPTKQNDGRTRNLPGHAQDKWILFKTYNKRDVEVEISIHERLSKFLVPDFIWKEYHLDQRINDTGVALDMKFVNKAIIIDEDSKLELTNAIKDLTELDNPNSVLQMKMWLLKNGIETEKLGKKDIIQLKEDCDDEGIDEVLTLRQQISKSSIKKYQAMKNAVCADGRARGMFQFYGANRTGRWCLTGDHEILTVDGWVRFDAWNGGYIACWNPKGEIISFQQSNLVSFDYCGSLYEYSDMRISQLSTPEHKMFIKKRYGGNWGIETVENMAKYRPCIPFTGYRRNHTCLENNELRVIVMIQGDGHYTVDGSIKLSFIKLRKVERCKKLLRAIDIPYTINITNQKGKDRFDIHIYSRNVPIWLRMFNNKTFGSWLLDVSADVFFDELSYWDGYRSAKNSIQYVTCNKQNADMVQGLAHITGRCATIKVKGIPENNPNWSLAYVVNVWLTPINCHEIRNKPTIIQHSGKVYCAETPTGFFLIRRDGKVWVTGKSSRVVQLQNMPQNHIPDLEDARELVKLGNVLALKMLYENIPDTLSQLIRTSFVPSKGCKFIVSDFSAIEARVIAWYADETWRLDAFRRGDDIYCASASQMFGVPVKKHGINGHLRQKGKIAELALGYGGSVGALRAMGALEMGLTEEELEPLVKIWRYSNPSIVAFWWDVDRVVLDVVRNKSSGVTHGLKFEYVSGILQITLPSGRKLSYIKPKIGINKFGSECVTYEGIGQAKKWERIESYGPKFVENIVQATARDILAFALENLKEQRIVMHIHDEVVIEAPVDATVEAICTEMKKTPHWAKGLILNADGYETYFYQKD